MEICVGVFLRRIPIGSHRGNSRSSDIPGTSKLSFCEACAEGKAHIYRAPFKPVGEIQSTKRLELVHSDVAGPMKTESFGGAKYFVTFIDDYSRCITVYPMKHKSEVLEKFKELETAVTNQADCKIKTLRTDNGGEYTSIRRDVTFNETDFGSTKVQMKCNEDGIKSVEEEIELNDEVETNVDKHQDLTKDFRRSERKRNPPLYYHDEYAGITTAKYAALYVGEQ